METTTAKDLGTAIVAHTAALRRYARVFVRSSDQADDLVQDCLARALSRPHLYRPDTNLRAWLFTMLRNIAITQSRKARLRWDYAIERKAMDTHTTAPNQIHFVALKESLRLMKTLAPTERQAVALLGVFNLTYEEAAKHARTEVGTMKSRLSRGRAHLRHLAEPMLEAA